MLHVRRESVRSVQGQTEGKKMIQLPDIDVKWSRQDAWYHFNLCPKCGEKVKTPTEPTRKAMIPLAPMYICPCLTQEDLERNGLKGYIKK